MKRLGCTTVVLASALLACLVVFAAWQYHGTVPLGNGYEYFYDDEGVYIRIPGPKDDRVTSLIGPVGERVILPGIGPDVDGYRVYDKIIVGHVKARKGFNPSFAHSDRVGDVPGYFIVDVSNYRVYHGLRKREWLNKLRHFGVDSEPRLFCPSILDELLGRNKPAK